MCYLKFIFVTIVFLKTRAWSKQSGLINFTHQFKIIGDTSERLFEKGFLSLPKKTLLQNVDLLTLLQAFLGRLTTASHMANKQFQKRALLWSSWSLLMNAFEQKAFDL